jgi:hypothetical protein
MFFANLFVLVGRRSFFGSFVLRLKIVLADLARAPLVRLEAVGSQGTSLALAGLEVINPAVVFRVAVAGCGCFSVRAGQFIARFVEFEILRALSAGPL